MATTEGSRAVPRVLEAEVDGRRLGLLEWGSGPTVVLLHPNGFCGGLFAPLARRLSGYAHVLAVDIPGHGRSDPPPTRRGYEFAALAGDVLTALDAVGVTDAAVVGESLGGAVAILADRFRPGVWRHMVLCEAVAFPTAGQVGAGNPLATAARARRRHWPDLATMRRSYATKAPLSELAPEAMDAYLTWGTRRLGDGSIELACHPDDEAMIFEVSAEPGGARAAWNHLPKLSSPSTIVAGSQSFLPGDWFTEQATRANSRHEVVEGGHFFLQADTRRAAGLLGRLLGLGQPVPGVAEEAKNVRRRRI